MVVYPRLPTHLQVRWDRAEQDHSHDYITKKVCFEYSEAHFTYLYSLQYCNVLYYYTERDVGTVCIQAVYTTVYFRSSTPLFFVFLPIRVFKPPTHEI